VGAQNYVLLSIFHTMDFLSIYLGEEEEIMKFELFLYSIVS